MTFQIEALEYAPFADLFAANAAGLAAAEAVIVTADASPGYPCRVSLEDAAPGERLVLVNHEHLSVASPYRARHAVYVREGARQARPGPGAVPEVLARRTLSLRGFDAGAMMQAAQIAQGADLAAELGAMFDDPAIRFVDIHFAAAGCFGARAQRATAGQHGAP